MPEAALASAAAPARPAAGRRPFVVGLGGALREESSSARALRFALRAAAEAGAETCLLPAAALNLPLYEAYTPGASRDVTALVEAVRRADGLILATPGYHGGMSGLVKNALDYLQELADGPAPYLHGRAVGCIVTAAGWQAAATTLVSLRSTVHALRGWPTPLGAAINSTVSRFGPDDAPADPGVAEQLRTLGRQVVAFARADVEGRAP